VAIEVRPAIDHLRRTAPAEQHYRLDGVSLNDYANGAPGSVLGGNLGVDAIQEFSVLTSNYSAEYGKTSGGVVNAITRSGHQFFSCSAYEFLRNSALDARNFFEDPTAPKAPFKRNQFGGAVGGPAHQEPDVLLSPTSKLSASPRASPLSTLYLPRPHGRGCSARIPPSGPFEPVHEDSASGQPEHRC